MNGELGKIYNSFLKISLEKFFAYRFDALVNIIFSTLNPLGTTIDKFVDNVQFFGVSHQRDYLKVSTRIGEPITYDQPTMLVYGYELIEKKPRIL